MYQYQLISINLAIGNMKKWFYLHPWSGGSAKIDANPRLLEKLELSVQLDELERGSGPVADLLGRPVGLVSTLLTNFGLFRHGCCYSNVWRVQQDSNQEPSDQSDLKFENLKYPHVHVQLCYGTLLVERICAQAQCSGHWTSLLHLKYSIYVIVL